MEGTVWKGSRKKEKSGVASNVMVSIDNGRRRFDPQGFPLQENHKRILCSRE